MDPVNKIFSSQIQKEGTIFSWPWSVYSDNGPVRNGTQRCIIRLFYTHTASHMLLMLLLDDLYVCIYERTNTAELKW